MSADARLPRAHRPADDGSTAGLRLRRVRRRRVARRPDDSTSRGRRRAGREGRPRRASPAVRRTGDSRASRSYFEVVPGSPLVYHAASDGIELELGIYDELVPGRPSFVLPADERLTRVTLPSDSFTHPLGRIDGVSIRTISPLALYQMRAAVMRTGVFGPPRPKDEAAQAQLRTASWRACSRGRPRARVRSVPAVGGRTVTHDKVWSGRRGSNSRHAAWKAAALPTELLPPEASAKRNLMGLTVSQPRRGSLSQRRKRT